MSEGNNQNWGKKGACLGQFLVAFLLFMVLLIYVYNHTQNGIN